jgi:DUF4097 and DUF4098 domain-containing protein YvlB
MRAGKVVLLLGVLAVGAGLETAVAIRDHVPFGRLGWRILGGRVYGPSFSFEEQRELELPAGAAVHVDNAFGAVRAHAGTGTTVKVHLRKVVYARDEAMARAFSAKVTLVDAREPALLRVSTNRASLDPTAVEQHGLETHLELELPANVRLEVRNEHGLIDATDLAAAALTTSFEAVHVARVQGNVQIESRHGDVEAREIGGGLDLALRHGDAEVRQVTGPAKIDVQHGDLNLEDAAALQLEHKFGDANVQRLRGTLVLRGEHASLEAAELDGAVDVETAFRGVKLRNVRSDVRVVNRHGSVDMQDVSGGARAQAAYDDVKLARITGAVEVAVQHGGVEAEDLAGGAKINASGDDVTLNGFRGVVEVESSRGDVNLTPDGPLQAAVSVRTENGGIVLVVPSGSRGELDAQTQHGELEIEDVSGLATDVEEAGSQGHARGRLGEGGGPITLRARQGSIRIEGRTASVSSKP